jgi:glycosyltransferase involved in cell wall biosynthesis
MDLPLVSIIIPCRNEEMFISDCLESLLKNDYPTDKVEVLIIDGLSNDNTLKIVQDYHDRNRNINIYENKKKVFPAAVNIGIRESKGDLIFIVGAHATYSHDYLSKCVNCSLKSGAENVGGAIDTVPVGNSLISRLITFVLSNSFGVGNSVFRTGADTICEVDTVFGGCYKKEVFQKFGNFNENLISTSDYEFNKRIKRGGASILLIPEIKIIYFTRSTFKNFVRNNLRNGYWAIYPIALSDKMPVSLRHLVPLAFIITIVVLLLGSIKWFFCIKILSVCLILYILASLYFIITSINKKYYLIPFLPVLFFILHVTYGLGSLWGAIRAILYKRKQTGEA